MWRTAGIDRVSVFGGVTRWPYLHRRAFPTGWLGIIASGRSASVVSLADDVADADIAAAIRHLMTEHATSSRVTACMAECGTAEIFRPSLASSTVASSA